MVTAHAVESIGRFPYAGYQDVEFVKCCGVIYPLTPCCHASAKGCDGYTGCRKCYAEVPSEFGAGWYEDEWKGQP